MNKKKWVKEQKGFRAALPNLYKKMIFFQNGTFKNFKGKNMFALKQLGRPYLQNVQPHSYFKAGAPLNSRSCNRNYYHSSSSRNAKNDSDFFFLMMIIFVSGISAKLENERLQAKKEKESAKEREYVKIDEDPQISDQIRGKMEIETEVKN